MSNTIFEKDSIAIPADFQRSINGRGLLGVRESYSGASLMIGVETTGNSLRCQDGPKNSAETVRIALQFHVG